MVRIDIDIDIDIDDDGGRGRIGGLLKSIVMILAH